ncbi:HEAT repeat domain-containing protein [Streptomyces sp. R35]|uniref:HEAT repeat domain-containing protein n=1 Tax=Streptomyces sp. R35 TaxID=3238630 RepID=A0AB39S7J2_9ACTN
MCQRVRRLYVLACPPQPDTSRFDVGICSRRYVEPAFQGIEPETKVRESALNSISEDFNHHRLPLDLGEPLATAMPTMEHELLEYALYVLGATHDRRARPLIEPFLHHPDPRVREDARLAAAEITASEGPTQNS